MSDVLESLQLDSSWHFYASPQNQRYSRSREKKAVRSLAKWRTKAVSAYRGNTEHFALGFLVQRAATSPKRKPAAPESYPVWSQRQRELGLCPGLVEVQSRGAHRGQDWKYICPLLWRGDFVPPGFAQSGVFSEMPRILEYVKLCAGSWWAECLQWRVSSMQGFLLLRIFFMWLQSIQCVIKLAKGKRGYG